MDYIFEAKLALTPEEKDRFLLDYFDTWSQLKMHIHGEALNMMAALPGWDKFDTDENEYRSKMIKVFNSRPDFVCVRNSVPERTFKAYITAYVEAGTRVLSYKADMGGYPNLAEADRIRLFKELCCLPLCL